MLVEMAGHTGCGLETAGAGMHALVKFWFYVLFYNCPKKRS